MPDIDSLSIKLTSSSQPAVKAVDNVINALSRLNAALNNYSDGSDYVKGINSLVGGLKGIADSINSIDLDKLKRLTSSLTSLSGAGEKIAKLNFVSSFSELGSEAQRANSAISNTARSIAKDFHIPNDEMASLTNSVRKLYSATNDTTFNEASRELEKLVEKYAKVEGATKEVAEAQKQFRGELSKSRIYLSHDVYSNMGDDAKRDRGYIGIQNTTTDITSGTDIVTAANEMGVYRDTSYEAAEALKELASTDIGALSKEEAVYNLSLRLDDLRTRILGVSDAMKSMNDDDVMLSGGFDPFGDEFEIDAAKAVKAIENVDNAMDRLQSEMTRELSNPFEGLILGLNSLKDIDIPAEKFAGVSTLSASLGRFGGKNVQAAIANIPKVGRAFAEMATEVSRVPKISDNLVRLAEALSRFSRSSREATQSAGGFNTALGIMKGVLSSIHTPTRRAHRSFTSLAAVFGTLYANFFLLIRAARLLGRAMDYSSSMTEAQNVVNVVFGQQAGVMDEFAKTAIKDFGLARLSATEFASRFQAMGSTMGITAKQVGDANDYITSKISGNTRAYQDLGDSVADMSINLTKLTADIASLYNQDYADVAADMQAIYTGMTRPLRKYGLDLTQATLKEWAMANGLDSNIEKMSQAEKTMLRYQYVMTRAAGAMGDFSKTADTWANSMRTVRQLLQEIARVIGEALINALRPALLAFKKFLFGFLEATESALNALGKLLGWKQIDFGGAALIDDTEGYADALDDAAGAAKKLKGQLRGIDELNNLTSGDKGGGGAGASSLLGVDSGSLWDSINDTERLYESSVEDFYDFGKRISTAIKNGLDSIDWESVYEKVGNFGRNLASFLNGLIQPDTFESIGKTIAGGLNTAFRFALEFGKEFDFRNVGVSLAEIINGFFRDFDFTQAAETINTWVEGFWDFVNGFFVGDENGEGGLDYNAITDGLTTFFKNLNWKSWVAILVPIFGKLTSSIIKIVSPILIKELTKKLSNPVVWTSLSSGLEKVFLFIFTRAFRVFEFAFDNVISPIIYSIFAFLSGYQIGNALGESIALLTGNYEEAQEYENASLMSILGVDMDLWEETWFEYFDDVRNKWDELIHNGSFLTIEEGAIDWSKLGFIDNPIEDFITNFNEATDSVEGFISVVSGSNNSDIGGVIDTVTEKVRTFREDTGKILEDWWNEDVAPVFDLPRWSGLVSTIKESINQVWTETVDFWVKEVPLWWDENVVPWFSKDRWDAMVESIFTSISEVWEDTKVAVNEFLEGWFDSLENDTFAKEHWLDIFSPIKEALSETFKAGVNLAVSALNALLKGIEDVLNFGGAAFNALIDLANAVSNKNLARWGNITIGEIPLPFANGGFPEVGSLFLAGEAGSEMVGTINGRSGVASNAEITGIADAIRSTSEIEIGLLRTQNALLQGILEKEFGISSDDVFRSVRTSAREFTRSTGRSAF